MGKLVLTGHSHIRQRVNVTPAASGPTAPLIWLEADRITGKSDGDSVSTWVDQSGNGYDATSGGAGINDPIYKTNIVNGKPVLRFNGTTSGLTWSGDWRSGLTQAEMFIVSKVDNDPPGAAQQAGHVVQAGGDTGGPHIAHFPFTDSNIYETFFTTARKTVGNPSTSMASAFWCYNVRSASGAFSAYFNSTQLFTTGTNTVGISGDGRYIGHDNGATNDRWFDGDAALILIYSSVLSSGDRTVTQAYITSQYGITF